LRTKLFHFASLCGSFCFSVTAVCSYLFVIELRCSVLLVAMAFTICVLQQAWQAVVCRQYETMHDGPWLERGCVCHMAFHVIDDV